jgi:hypothetical protein
MYTLEHAANDAIFILQLNTQDAIKYVVKHSFVTPKQASEAISKTLKWYKK